MYCLKLALPLHQKRDRKYVTTSGGTTKTTIPRRLHRTTTSRRRGSSAAQDDRRAAHLLFHSVGTPRRGKDNTGADCGKPTRSALLHTQRRYKRRERRARGDRESPERTILQHLFTYFIYRRNPPLQQVATRLAARSSGKRHRDPYCCHHRTPFLRGHTTVP